MLTDLLSPECIQFNVTAASAEEAVRKAVQPLIDTNKVSESYVNGILNSLAQYGPYFVIMKGVALPHATTEEGALETAIGITVLRTPVSFGSVNDPVKYLFTLSAKDNFSHIRALAELADLLENKAFFTLLDNTTSPYEVMQFLEQNSADE